MVIASGVIERGHLSPFGGPQAADSSSSFFSEDLVVPPERQQVVFWKSESMVVQRGSKSVFASPLEKIYPMGANSEGGVEHSGGQGIKGLDILRVGKLMGQGNGSTLPSISWGNMIMTPGSREASGTSRIMATGQSVDTHGFFCEGDEPLGSMEEVEAQTIGDLLPTDDDLISGVVDGFDFAGLSINQDDADEDIFGTGGGMELESDDSIDKCAKNLEGSLMCHFSSPQKLSSPIRIEPTRQYNNQAAISELGGSLGKGNFGRGMQMFHPHSLPECGVCNISKSMTSDGRNAGFRSDGVDYGHLQKVGSGSSLHGHSFDQNNEGIGIAGVGSFPLHGHHYSWNNSNAFPQSPSSPMMWSPVRMHDYPGAPPHALNTGAYPTDQHHMGSAPNNGGGFRNIHLLGSLGSAGFPGNPRLYPSDLAVFAPARGNYRETMFSPVGAGFPSLQQMCRGINGRNPMVHVSSSYDATNDRMRSRRHDRNNVQPENKRQFELDIECIAKGEDLRTTLMIKNIPNKYNCKLLLAVIDENHRGTYDFVYLPIDFKNKCNVGYAFINMTHPQHIIPFYKTFNGKRWEKFNSEKVASLAYARIQGRSDLISHFRNSSLMNEDKWCRPILFHKDGPNAGDQEPFPVGNSIRPRTGRNRPLHNSDTRDGDASLSTSPNQDNSSRRAKRAEDLLLAH